MSGCIVYISCIGMGVAVGAVNSVGGTIYDRVTLNGRLHI